jgi:hypothetical protein
MAEMLVEGGSAGIKDSKEIDSTAQIRKIFDRDGDKRFFL